MKDLGWGDFPNKWHHRRRPSSSMFPKTWFFPCLIVIHHLFGQSFGCICSSFKARLQCCTLWLWKCRSCWERWYLGGGGAVVNQTFRLQIKTHLEGHKSLCRLNWVSWLFLLQHVCACCYKDRRKHICTYMGPIGCFHGCLKNEGVFVFTVVSSSNRGKNNRLLFQDV